MKYLATVIGTILCGGALVLVPVTAHAQLVSFKDTYSRGDVSPSEDSLGTTETGPGLTLLNYREIDAPGGATSVVDVAKIENGTITVYGKSGTTNAAFVELDDAGPDFDFQIDAEFLALNPSSVANNMTFLLRNSGATLFTPGEVVFALKVDGTITVKGVFTDINDIGLFVVDVIDESAFAAADTDGDGLLETGEPFTLRLTLVGDSLSINFDGLPQVTDLDLSVLPDPPPGADRLLFGRNRLSLAIPTGLAVRFDNLISLAPIDEDADGFLSDEDCDDLDASTFPGAQELCDGKDNDCNDVVPSDEDDADGDGFRGCENDCDESDPSINPDAIELPGNFVDENCDGGLGDVDPCAAWQNHGKYVRAVAHAANDLVTAGLITEEQGDALVSSAAMSKIGKTGFVPPECQ